MMVREFTIIVIEWKSWSCSSRALEVNKNSFVLVMIVDVLEDVDSH